MEEMMMVMMKINTNANTNTNPNTISNADHQPHHHSNLKIPTITTTISPTWKLYENPFYISHQKDSSSSPSNSDHKQVHRLHLPISSRKIAASFWDLTFIKPFMDSELDSARARIADLERQVETERRSLKNMESLNKKLAKEATDERQAREALERVCEDLGKEISLYKGEMGRIRREFEDERRMLRTAEVIREERVQMKLAEAKILLEEKLSEMEAAKAKSGDNEGRSGEDIGVVKRVRGESVNPHIKRGIRGFVEFPRVVRAIGCRSGKQLGSKLECQKAQLKILLKHKGNLRFNGLIPR